MKVLTIIIPGYNIAKYIVKLMASLLAGEALGKLQILLVNDGSSDNTLELAQEYENRYPTTLKILDKENGGHGSAINYGLKFAEGKYVMVVDGDDWVNPEALPELLRYLEEKDVDVVAADYYVANEQAGIYYKRCCTRTDYRRIYHFGPMAFFIQYMQKCRVKIENGKIYDFESVCLAIPNIEFHSIIYNRSILKQNQRLLDEHCFYVDTEYILFPFVYVRNIAFFNTPVYMYRFGNNSQSVSRENYIKNRKHLQKVSLRLAGFYEEEKANVSPAVAKYLERRIKVIVKRTYAVLKKVSDDGKMELSGFDSSLKKESLHLYKAVPLKVKMGRLFGRYKINS